jgi:hypothetical protein
MKNVSGPFAATCSTTPATRQSENPIRQIAGNMLKIESWQLGERLGMSRREHAMPPG